MESGSFGRTYGGQFFFLLSFFCLLTSAVDGLVTNSTAVKPKGKIPPLVPGKMPAPNATLYNAMLDTCHGVVIRYTVDLPEKIFPVSKLNKTQPYKFKADIDVVNAGYTELPGWEMFIGFQYHEVIAEAVGIQFMDGSTPPGALVENGTLIMGTDTPDLLTSINTAEDLALIAAKFNLTGTEFGVGPFQPIQYPLPHIINLNNSGYSCNKPVHDQNSTLLICCPENSSVIVNTTVDYLRRYKGDITIYYDVLSTSVQEYNAQVTINMDNPIGMLNHWNLTWDWMHGEFINSMKGAQTILQEQDDCINGPAGIQYPGLDFSQVMSCQKTPSIVDLSADRMADQNIPGCCRNGTLLPAVLDPAQTKSVFLLEVFKLLPASQHRGSVSPPLHWRIGSIQAGASPYVCGSPRKVSPSEFYVNGLHYNSAVVSWQVTCNQTAIPKKAPHKCCVSFSGYYNNSIVPCPTCACGCQQRPILKPDTAQCDANPDVEAMLLPSFALLLPSSNRTVLANALARLDHLPRPNPMPCPDNCGVSINWHVYSNYANGFSGRVTLFNWDGIPLNPWFAAMEFGKATPGYQNVYSFNGTRILGFEHDPNRTLIFMHGKDGYNGELLGLDTSQNPEVPGKLQSLMSFDKRKTPGLDVVGGDGFPERVWFNGDECALPDIFPISSARRTVYNLGLLLSMALLVFALSGPLPLLF